MKKLSIRKFLLFVSCFCVILLIPEIINSIIWIICMALRLSAIPYIRTDDWFTLMAIAFPSALTYLVIRQSEQQQEENERLQIRMERLNEKIFNTELKSKIGYFVPEVDKKDIHGRWVPYSHPLKKGIDLIHAGDDIVFVIEASYVFQGKRLYVKQNEPICFLNKLSFNCYCLECDFTDEDLDLPQIDLDIELVMKNSKGYQYKQIINLGFDNDHGIGIINRFNMSIQEVSTDAG